MAVVVVVGGGVAAAAAAVIIPAAHDKSNTSPAAISRSRPAMIRKVREMEGQWKGRRQTNDGVRWSTVVAVSVW